jgi:hypothetical protein
MSATEAIGKCKHLGIPLSTGSAKFLVTVPCRLVDIRQSFLVMIGYSGDAAKAVRLITFCPPWPSTW